MKKKTPLTRAGGEKGLVYAKFPCAWMSLINTLEEEARRIKRVKTADNEKRFHAQIRFRDKPVGFELFVKQIKLQPGAWMPVRFAKKILGDDAFVIHQQQQEVEMIDQSEDTGTNNH